jgi:type VI protein secretion system component VasF
MVAAAARRLALHGRAADPAAAVKRTVDTVSWIVTAAAAALILAFIFWGVCLWPWC